VSPSLSQCAPNLADSRSLSSHHDYHHEKWVSPLSTKRPELTNHLADLSSAMHPRFATSTGVSSLESSVTLHSALTCLSLFAVFGTDKKFHVYSQA